MSQNDRVKKWIVIIVFLMIVLGVLAVASRSIMDLIKTSTIFMILIGVLIWAERYVKNDIFLEIVSFALFLALFKFFNNYLVLHKTHYDLGSAFAVGYAMVKFLTQKDYQKPNPLWKVLAIIAFLALYTAIDFKLAI